MCKALRALGSLLAGSLRSGSLLLALALCGSASAQGLVEFGASLPLNTNAAQDQDDDINPELVSNGQDTWLAVWWTTEIQNNSVRLGETRFARSTDAGASWTAPAPISTLSGATRTDARPSVATDGNGNWVAVWISTHSLGGTIGSDFDILLARSTDDGITWTSPTMLNTNAASDVGSDFDAHVTTDGQGTWLAAWESNDPLGNTIGSDYDILVARSTNAGVNWTAPAPLNADAAGDTRDDALAVLETDGQGNWLAVWEAGLSAGGTNIMLARSMNGGVTWTAPVALNTSAGDHFGPQLTTDGMGNWLALWATNASIGNTLGRDFDIVLTRSTDAGVTWTPPAALNTNAGSDSRDDGLPRLTTDRQGTWLAVWNSNDSLGGTIGTADFNVLLAESTDAGATWTAPAPLNTNAACDVGNDFDARVATDGQGTWLALWRSDDPRGGMIGRDFDLLVALPDSDPIQCQSRAQQACTNALNANYDKVAKAQDSAIAKCLSDQARNGLSATACLALPDPRIDRAQEKTRTDEAQRCVATPPDFGPLEADTINAAAVAGERATLSDVFGPDLDAAIALQANDPDASKCQLALVKAAQKCQSTQIKEFNRCKKSVLKTGAALDAEGLASCLAFDPQSRIAKKCDPISGELAAKVLPRSCGGVDLAGAFPGCGTADPDDLASCIDQAIACRVCLGLAEADDLGEDCDLFDDDVSNASCP